jgi:hypothetical protein
MAVRVAGVGSVLVGCVVAVFLLAVQVSDMPHGWPLTAVRTGALGVVGRWWEESQSRLRGVDGGLPAGEVSGVEGVEGVEGVDDTGTRTRTQAGSANYTATDADNRGADVLLASILDDGGTRDVLVESEIVDKKKVRKALKDRLTGLD